MRSVTPASRIRALNDAPVRPDCAVVLYWMIAARRLHGSFALDHAMARARELGRPLVILEPLRAGYRWANDRLHRFVIDGMAAHTRALAGTPVTYLPYVEAAPGDGRGLLRALAAQAAVVVTDDYPCFFLPRMTAAAAAQIDVRLEAIDGNGVLPMRGTDRTFPTAYAFRAHLQREFRDAMRAWPSDPDFDDLPARWHPPASLLARWPMAEPDALTSPDALIGGLPIDHKVAPAAIRGGGPAARQALARFVDEALPRYAEDQKHPDLRGTSRLSPYLHFGHLGAHEVFAAVMRAEGWTSRRLAERGGGARAGWWGASPGAEAFLDQLITWRELGFNMCATRPDDYDRYDSLPDWARRTLGDHGSDPRTWTYTPDEFERARTHDDVWNAAQRQLVRDGWMHNYLRMLWGKKILEWTPDPHAALETMIAVMNRWALDGRDPNSYTGYLWTLGRYDRPWAPSRPIFGTVRYMSSDNTKRKLKMKGYLAAYGAQGQGALEMGD
ncbi:MAG: hypothetical protein R2752_15385 [Vicinamibacterales bacterium]